LPSAVLAMAWRMLITPTFPLEAEPGAAAAPWAWTAAVPSKHIAAKAAARTKFSRDQVEADILKLTVFSFSTLAAKRPAQTATAKRSMQKSSRHGQLKVQPQRRKSSVVATPAIKPQRNTGQYETG
jgi:hypothetical protein